MIVILQLNCYFNDFWRQTNRISSLKIIQLKKCAIIKFLSVRFFLLLLFTLQFSPNSFQSDSLTQFPQPIFGSDKISSLKSYGTALFYRYFKRPVSQKEWTIQKKIKFHSYKVEDTISYVPKLPLYSRSLYPSCIHPVEYRIK